MVRGLSQSSPEQALSLSRALTSPGTDAGSRRADGGVSAPPGTDTRVHGSIKMLDKGDSHPRCLDLLCMKNRVEG
jgi:hypothetical protein